ncbi:hypothetical protein NEUTE2DRAFT_35081, partial [Neurospora tetrasperma FGSC 2509]
SNDKAAQCRSPRLIISRLNVIADPVWLTQNNDHDFPTGSSYTQLLHRLVAVELSRV